VIPAAFVVDLASTVSRRCASVTTILRKINWIQCERWARVPLYWKLTALSNAADTGWPMNVSLQ
jgi:hypothetical protein